MLKKVMSYVAYGATYTVSGIAGAVGALYLINLFDKMEERKSAKKKGA